MRVLRVARGIREGYGVTRVARCVGPIGLLEYYALGVKKDHLGHSGSRVTQVTRVMMVMRVVRTIDIYMCTFRLTSSCQLNIHLLICIYIF